MGDVPSPSVVCFDPKKGEENFARLCQFLMTICGDILRVVLSHHIKPGDLRSQLDLNQSRLDRITNAQEKDLLSPPHSSTTCCPPIRSKDLDLSLLYKILRNICNIPKHRAGWGNPPDSGDYTLSACIERIRLLRNSISGHSTNGTIDDTQFEDYWQDLKTSVEEIEKDVIGSDKYERGIDHLHDCDLNPTKAKEYVAQIRKIRGEVAIKRERIDMVENTCIEIGEEIDAKKARLDTIEKNVSDMKVRLEKTEQNQAECIKTLTATNAEILREVKELKMQVKVNEFGSNTSIFSFRMLTKKTAIEIEDVDFFVGMSPTIDNKCWIAFQTIEGSTLACLLNDNDVIMEVDLSERYAPYERWDSITTNEKGEAIFLNDESIIAVTQDGTVYDLFNASIPGKKSIFPPSLCFLHSGNYIVTPGRFSGFPLSIHEFNRDGVQVRVVTTRIFLDDFRCNIRQNNNRDIIFTGSRSLFIVAADDFSLKHGTQLAEHGVVVPCMNSSSDLLYGHGKTIDLLTCNGQFIKTVYTAQKEKQVESIACSENGTVWDICSSSEVEVLKLEI